MTRHATLPVPDPDPRAMVLRTQLGTIESGEWKGSGFGIAGAAIYLDAERDGKRLGIVVIPATMWVGAITSALEGEREGPRFPVYTLNQAAEELGVSASTLRNQVNAGRIAATKVGNVWTIASDEVARYRRESLGQRKGGKA